MDISYSDNLIKIEALKLYKKDLESMIKKAKNSNSKKTPIFSLDFTEEDKEMLKRYNNNNKYIAYIAMLNEQLQLVDKQIKSSLRYKYKLNKETNNMEDLING